MVKLFERLGLWVVDLSLRNKWLALLSMLMLTGALLLPIGNLSMSSEYRAYFGSENPQLTAFDNVEASYSKVDNVLFVVQPGDKQIFSQDSYPIIQRITEEAWQLPAVTRVDSISNYQHTAADGDDLIVDDLLPLYEEISDEDLASKLMIAMAEPTLVGNLISHNGSTAGISAQVDLLADPDAELEDLVAAARELASNIEADYPDVTIAITGAAFLSNAFTEAATQDATSLIPLMYLVLFIVMTLVYRNTYATLITIVVVLSSTIMALGVGGLTGVELNSISVSIPIVVMTLAVADSVHILVSMLTLMRTGMDKMSAIREAMRINFVAVAVTSLTTIIGFLCLNFSDAPPFWHLGNLSAVGILAAWMISVVLIPAAVAILPIQVNVENKEVYLRAPPSLRLMRWLAELTTSHSGKIIIACALFSALLISAIPKLEFDDQFIDFFDTSLDFRTDTDFTIEELSGIYSAHFDLRSGEDSGITNPEYLAVVHEFSEWLRAHEDVRNVYSFTDIMLRLNKSMHSDQQEWYRLPENKELAAQYLLIYELSLPYGLNLTDRITFDKSASRLTVILDKISSAKLRKFSVDSQQWLKQNAPPVMHTEQAGTATMFAYITKRNLDSMVVGNAIAIILIAIVMMLALEHFGLGLLSMLPNLLPILLTFGLWSVLFGVVGMTSAIVMALSLGIVVDNTTHFLSKYQRSRREQNKSTADAIRYAFEIVGTALMANAIILAAGFAILAFSLFKPNVQMGALTAMAIVLALIIDLLLLPALLMVFVNKKQTKEALN